MSAEGVYKAARLARDLDATEAEIEKFGFLAKLPQAAKGLAGGVKDYGKWVAKPKAQQFSAQAGQKWRGLPAGQRRAVTIGGATGAAGLGGGYLGSKIGD